MGHTTEDTDTLSEERILEHLRANPCFFVEHQAALRSLTIPHPIQGTVSLLEYQNQVLREDARLLTEQLHRAIMLYREQRRVNRWMQELCFSLQRMESLHTFLQSLESSLADTFNVSHFSVFTTETQLNEKIRAPLYNIAHPDIEGYFGKALYRNEPIVGQFSKTTRAHLFPRPPAPKGEVIVIPLSLGARGGVIALATKPRPQSLMKSHGSFITFVGHLVERAIRLHRKIG